MTQEDKALLLKDLCARLPYNVIISCTDSDTDYNCFLTTDILNELLHNIEYYNYKPYLRSMLSMTDEEREEMYNLLSPEGTAIYGNDGIALPINHCCEFVPYEFMNRIIQYLLKKHFDFMGLIPKYLAIEVTEKNNPY